MKGWGRWVAPVPFCFLWTLDLGFGTWILDLDLGVGFGTGLGLDNILHFKIILVLQVFLVTGGSGDSYVGLDSTEVYDPSVGSWTVTGARLPRTMFGLTATNIEDRILIFGE